MASQVLSGASNASYTNNTTQNVRLIINYMTNVTSMTWSSSSGGNVTVTGSSATIGKDVAFSASSFRIEGEVRSITPDPSGGTGTQKYVLGGTPTVREITKAVGPGAPVTGILQGSLTLRTTSPSFQEVVYDTSASVISGSSANNVTTANIINFPNYVYAPLRIVPDTSSTSNNFPVELMLAPNQSFSAVCGAFNAIVIKEDGT